MSVVIVGASVAGIRTAQALRMQGFAGAITVVGEEVHEPYDKPPLSKQHLTGDTPIPLVTPDQLAALDLDLRLGTRAIAVEPGGQFVETSDGKRLQYSTLVIATGVRPRTLPGAESTTGVHTIRTVDDARLLHEALATQPRVVVIGAGFIGSEFASAARGFGCDVTIVEAQAVPMAALFGPAVGAELGRLHELSGVHLHTGVMFDHFDRTSAGAVSAVVQADGQALPADLVVIGVGAEPAIGWLASSGLPVSDGVVCDELLRVVGHDNIYAVGDVASWPHGLYGGRRLRIEHWTNANEHASIVAAGLLGKPIPAPQPPYVWSDQYGHRIQIVGRPSEGELFSLTGAVDDKMTALFASPDGQVVCGIAVDDPRMLMAFRKAILKRRPAGEVLVGPPIPSV